MAFAQIQVQPGRCSNPLVSRSGGRFPPPREKTTGTLAVCRLRNPTDVFGVVVGIVPVGTYYNSNRKERSHRHLFCLVVRLKIKTSPGDKLPLLSLEIARDHSLLRSDPACCEVCLGRPSQRRRRVEGRGRSASKRCGETIANNGRATCRIQEVPASPVRCTGSTTASIMSNPLATIRISSNALLQQKTAWGHLETPRFWRIPILSCGSLLSLTVWN